MQQEDRKALGLQYLGKIGKIQVVRDIKEFQTSLNSLVGVPARLPLPELGTRLQDRGGRVDVRNLKKQPLLRCSCHKMLEVRGEVGTGNSNINKKDFPVYQVVQHYFNSNNHRISGQKVLE